MSQLAKLQKLAREKDPKTRLEHFVSVLKDIQLGEANITELVESLDTAVQIDELLEAFKIVVALSKETRDLTKEQVERLQTLTNETLDTLTERVNERLAAVKDGAKGEKGDKGDFVVGPKGEKGDKGESIVGPQGEPGKDGDDADIAPILEKIDEIEDEIEELKNRPMGQGGGVTNARIQQAFKYILKTEQPVGDIDGANTTYTLSQPIFAILSMSLNGETIAQLPNYTISGRTFTFSTALPAAYSGKDWEVKYV